jgi:RNA polymerase sigma factor for flagellar operon FliA
MSLDAPGGECLRDNGNVGTLGEIIADHKVENQFAAASQSQTVGRIAEAVEALPEQLRMIVSLYYYEDLNMKEIGGILGVSESRVCQVHTSATDSLRASLSN